MDRFLMPLIIGYILDLILGDPVGWPHSICAIGNLIAKSEKFIRSVLPKTEKGEKIGGLLLVLWVTAVSGLASFVLLCVAEYFSIYLRLALESLMCWQCLAAKSLKSESMNVYYALETGSIEESRRAVSMIVGRNTRDLSFEGVTKAAVETVAENTSDGVIAPAVFMALGGGVMGFIYKAVNTMDSMVGYKNDKYINFGRAAAKTDDIFNFIPSRISAVLMIMASFILGYNGRNAVKIFLRDRLKHASPNSAQTEAVCAGALEIRLAGDAWYFGKLYKKEFIGDNIKIVENNDIKKANKLMYTASFLMMAFFAAVYIF